MISELLYHRIRTKRLTFSSYAITLSIRIDRFLCSILQKLFAERNYSVRRCTFNDPESDLGFVNDP